MSGNFRFREFYLRLFRRRPAGRRLRAQGGRLLIGYFNRRHRGSSMLLAFGTVHVDVMTRLLLFKKAHVSRYFSVRNSEEASERRGGA